MLFKFLVFCLVTYLIFRALSFILRLGRVVSTQKRTWQHMQEQFNRQAGGQSQSRPGQARKQRVGDVYIDHVPPQQPKPASPKATGSGEYVDYEEVKD